MRTKGREPMAEALTVREYLDELARQNSWDADRQLELLLEFVAGEDLAEELIRFVTARAEGISPDEVDMQPAEPASIVVPLGSRTGQEDAPFLDQEKPQYRLHVLEEALAELRAEVEDIRALIGGGPKEGA
jgi:hypothetical protein